MKTDASRYSAIDEYTLEELIRQYVAATPRERVAMIAGLYEAGVMPPFEVALRAVADESTLVRQWMARHARYLDYRDSVEHVQDADELQRFNLLLLLLNDSDDFVRAALYENRHIYADTSTDEWQQMFADATHLERLAMVRNPRTHGATGLLETLFDPDSPHFGLSMPEREQIVSALLIGRQALTDQHRSGQDLPPEPWDAHLFSNLWRLLSKWPAESKVKKNIYLYIGATIKTKAGIYRQCKQAAFRADILRNLDAEDTDTLELAMKDSDNLCRFLAYLKVTNLSQARLESLLETEDVYALLGLAENESLNVRQLEEVKDRLFALGAHEQARWATETIHKIEQNQPPQEASELFDENHSGHKFLAEKVHRLGAMVLELQREIQDLRDELATTRVFKS